MLIESDPFTPLVEIINKTGESAKNGWLAIRETRDETLTNWGLQMVREIFFRMPNF